MVAAATGAVLRVEGLNAGYGDTQVLWDVAFEIAPGEIVAIIGSNGAGKSTLMMTVCGNPRARAGSIVFAGRDITRLATHEIARLKIALFRPFDLRKTHKAPPRPPCRRPPHPQFTLAFA